MADDWQDTALNSKHIPHGRGKKSSRGKGKSKGEDVFNPNSALGSYELSGSALEHLGAKLILEIHELTDTPGGIFGSMVLPDRFKAAVLLAGSRKQLSNVMDDVEAAGEEPDSSEDESEDEPEDTGDEDDEDADSELELEKQDRLHNERVEAFQKNSFRNPKFFLAWQGEVTLAPGQVKVEKNRGYVVFSGNDCRNFEGTLSCSSIGWKDVAMKGRKTTSKARAPPFSWLDFLEDGQDGSEEDEGASPS
ncbi:hypothetical protein KC330_g7248 [Hortaea werneckii]|nr:hypothetical protein KC330_g7248 [Hortaea werneckii]